MTEAITTASVSSDGSDTIPWDKIGIGSSRLRFCMVGLELSRPGPGYCRKKVRDSVEGIAGTMATSLWR